MPIIYKTTNQITDKSYIGFTGFSLEKREKIHYKDMKKGSNTYFHKALRKYKSTDWVWKIIAECETREEAGEIEKQAIIEHNTFGKYGYNSTTGGDSGFTVSKATKEKQSKAHMGVPRGPHSVEHKRKLSEAHLGLMHTDETRKKLSKIKTGVKLPPFSKAHKSKISKALTGKPKSTEHKQKLSEAAKRRKRNS